MTKKITKNAKKRSRDDDVSDLVEHESAIKVVKNEDISAAPNPNSTPNIESDVNDNVDSKQVSASPETAQSQQRNPHQFFPFMMPGPFFHPMYMAGMPFQYQNPGSSGPTQNSNAEIPKNSSAASDEKESEQSKIDPNEQAAAGNPAAPSSYPSMASFFSSHMTPMQAAQNAVPTFLVQPRPSFAPHGFPAMMSLYGPRRGIAIALSCDIDQLSEYQILLRQQLELFEAGTDDVESNTQGRKKQVVLDQVGLRCRHCASYPLRARGRGAVYYPAKLHGVYQAAQNMAGSHLCQSCLQIPPHIKQELQRLRERRDNASGGKQYWADGCGALGLYESEEGLKLKKEAPNTETA
jgi:hypothetical protein